MKFQKGYSSRKSGFTLLELLIVVGIIGALSVALVLVLNPAEALKKSRDAQRMSDLNTLKKVLGIYAVSSPSPKLAGIDNSGCKGTQFGSAWQPGTDYIYYSYPSDSAPITGKSLDGVTFTTGGAKQVTKANLGKNDGTGWLPIDFTSLSGGSPISALPVDPVNTISDPASPKSTDLVYRYVCSEQNLTYELDATLESDAYTVTDNKMAKDGGNNNSYYEAGTGLALMTYESPTILSLLGDMIPLVQVAYNQDGNYSNACASVSDLITAISGLGGTAQCYSYDNTRWGAAAKLNSDNTQNFAVNSTGVVTFDTADKSSSNWDPANTACATAGGRLPSLEELKALSLAYSSATPPSFVANVYWSGTADPAGSTSAYKVGMDYGDVGSAGKASNTFYVRCVH